MGTLTALFKWSRLPAPTAEQYPPVCSAAEAAEALEKAGPTKPANARGAQVFTWNTHLMSAPESVRAGIARHIPRKDLAAILPWLDNDVSPLVYAEVLARQAANNGHKKATCAVLGRLGSSAYLCKNVAGILGKPSPWLLDTTHAPGNHDVHRSMLALLSAFRPLTAEEQTRAVLTWDNTADLAETVDGSAETFLNILKELTSNHRTAYAASFPVYTLAELTRHYLPPAETYPTIVWTRHSEKSFSLKQGPWLPCALDRAVVEGLDVALQRNLLKWEKFADLVDRRGSGEAVRRMLTTAKNPAG